MNAFFASIEQRDFPELRGRPVVITNGEQGTCIITCSYEARAFGIHTGMRLREARRRCHDLVRRPARPAVYARVSTAIMRALECVSPDIEVFSVDEAFLDVTRCQRLHGTPLRMARMVKRQVYEASGLLCSVGVSGDKTTAKFAAKLEKPDGLTVIPPWEARERLAGEPVTALCGIADGIAAFLAEHGVRRCGEVGRLPVSVLARRFGNLGRRIWLMCQGEDPEGLHPQAPPPKSVGHGKVTPPDTRDRRLILAWLRHMSEKVGARLRRHGLAAQVFHVGVRTSAGWIARKARLPVPGNHGGDIYRLARGVLDALWRGEGIGQVQVTALDPRPVAQQCELFGAGGTAGEVDAAMDRVNRRFGDLTLAPARLLQRSCMPDVIAPAWKPDGLRQTIDER